MITEPSPLLLLPGLLCDRRLWQNQINHLKDIANITVPDTSQHDSVEAIARDILTIAPPSFALAGLSMGGYVAFEIMRQAPDRVTKLGILNSSARTDTPEQQQKRRLLLAMSQTGQFKGVTPRLLPMLIHPDHVRDTTLTGIITAMAEEMGREAFARQQTAILNRPDSRPLLKNIACPTLIIGARQDAVTPPELLAEMADGIPDADYHIIEECGHLSPLEQPDRVNNLMRQWITG